MPPECSLPSWALEQQRASWSLGQQRASWALGQQRAALKPRRLHRERERISCGGGVALLRSARTDLLCRTDLLVRQRSLRAQCPPVLQGLWDPWATRLVKSAVGVVCILRKFGDQYRLVHSVHECPLILLIPHASSLKPGFLSRCLSKNHPVFSPSRPPSAKHIPKRATNRTGGHWAARLAHR